ncbi:Histidine kinase-, DNA gyrase B-, and HSP90-like ATPase [Butyrivibrio fibrisolvens 16/4]|nr:Histidine kinase-, DNA gyrase B-, and HSP90-like ATPase [Butyrivibrio fibrisolvens 16/4]
MGASIVDIKNMGDALRNTGYKNIESAVSEIIDNSVEANAKNIFLILREGIASSGRKVVTEVGFLDNGDGMDSTVLGNCLGIGASTRQARKGMGRFGVGLPQASLYACPLIEVYSWQNGIENAKKVYLDIEKIKNGVQTEIEDPVSAVIPEPYADYISYRTLFEEYDFSKSGTLVIWKNCDRINPKTRGPLTERLEFSLGQKFRYFIHDGVSQIKIVCDENRDAAVDVAPNDPMFLMEDNCVLCKEDDPKSLYRRGQETGLEAPFELYTAKGTGTGEIDTPIKYINKDGEVATANVKLRFSIVKDKFYDETAFPKGTNPGNYALGKYAAKLEGISVIRARREIDFRKFNFYNNVNEPQHRWWGCEIIFDPELDEAFGVANNKQYVELKEVDVNDLDPEERDVLPVWAQLVDIIRPTIKAMYAQNEETRSSTRSFGDTVSPSTDIINTVENDPATADFDDMDVEKEPEPSEEEAAEKGKEELKNLGYENPTDEQGKAFMHNKINFAYEDKGERSPAFDYKIVLSTTLITINTSHKFYTSFLQKIYGNPEVKTTFELFIASLIQSIRRTNTYQQNENDRLLSTWYNKLNNYISEQLNPRNTK